MRHRPVIATTGRTVNATAMGFRADYLSPTGW